MVVPSNDTFLGNDDPIAHRLFDGAGNFVGKSFLVSGDESYDAGTEVNDEVASPVAFLGQAAPDTGVAEGGVITTPSPGFAPPGQLSYPDGVLNHPAFAMGDFEDADAPLLLVRLRHVDLGGRVLFTSHLTSEQEVQASLVRHWASPSLAALHAGTGDKPLVRGARGLREAAVTLRAPAPRAAPGRGRRRSRWTSAGRAGRARW